MAGQEGSSAPAPRALARNLDLAGAGLAVCSCAWTFVAAAGGGRPGPVAGLQAGCAGTYALARVATRWQRPLVPVAATGLVVALLVLGSVLPSVDPLGPPLGYANANAALYVLAAAAAGMAGAAFPRGPGTAVAVPVGAAFVVAALLSGSAAAAVIVVSLGVVVLGARVLRSHGALILGCALAIQLAVAATVAVGLVQRSSPRPWPYRWAERLVDERRAVLWRDAAALVRERPLAGVGPGRFQELSPTARLDPDARWAHSGFLQQGAEGGAVGFALVLGAFGWALARLAATRPADAFVSLGAVAAGALGLHASVDYVLHAPLVPLLAAALAGAASAGAPRPPKADTEPDER